MSLTAIALAGFAILVVLLLIRVPVGIAMAIAGIAGFSLVVGIDPAISMVSQVAFNALTAYEFSIIPMFILMGTFAAKSDLSLEMFRASQAWLGRFRGGMAFSALVASAGFAAVNGSSMATAATMTRVALPEMERNGYDGALSAGVIAAGGTLGIMIPPSAVLALYGFITQQNVADLFIAGILPGLLGLACYASAILILGFFRPASMPVAGSSSWSEKLISLSRVWAIALLFGLIIGGIYGGVFTVTEAAGIGAFGAWLIGTLRGRLGVKATLECLGEALAMSAAIFTIVIGALTFGYFLTVTGTTTALIGWLANQPVGPYGVLTLILLGYLVLGAVMDELAITLLTLPIVFPVIQSLGFDPIWFGVIFVMTVTLGVNTPPIGMNVFVINSIARHISLGRIYRAVMPFIAVDLVRLLLLILFPSIALYLVY
ncbi:TRAP transporter large permease [Pararhodobacter zhoushanensis]|uniref:TRAP transporter large permease protein n=1 Tax=Pararhodobacter zhoushanensis TaxID=2479545 RepID=A0ABT3H546_9RHOB|nr:TRAP transporter large permease [Pararhodobacter zhoushanensis]MCW1934899.1 TRAP transporter large permease [Pararhodobacter zhoushanensis]